MFFKRLATFAAVMFGLFSIFFMSASMTLMLAHGVTHTAIQTPEVWEGIMRAVTSGFLSAAFAAAAR
jgi:hypothetical protein